MKTSTSFYTDDWSIFTSSHGRVCVTLVITSVTGKVFVMLLPSYSFIEDVSYRARHWIVASSCLLS